MKIESLTQNQIARFPEFIKKWTEIGLSTEKANRKEAEEGIREMYSIAGLKEPKIVWCDSPLSQGLTRLVVQKLTSDKRLHKDDDDIVGKSKNSSVSDSVRASVWASVRASVKASVSDSVSDSVRASVGDSVWDSVWASVSDSVRTSVWASVWASVRASVRDSVWASVRASVSDSVWASVKASVSDSVRTSVRASVGDSVWASVSDSGWDSVWASVGDSGYGQHDANWLAFYDFFKDVNRLDKETEKLKGMWKVSKNAGWYLPHEKICWISERQSTLHRNAQGRLHNERGMALSYPDGWGIYALNGVRFPEKLFKEVTSGKMSFDKILAIVDIDQRTQAMRFGDVRQFLSHSKADKLDSYQKSDINGDIINYELFKISKGDIFQQDAYYMIYDCPSTKKVYMSGVEPFKTVAEAMAWKQYITPEMWKLQIPLKHES